jgi:lipocalin
MYYINLLFVFFLFQTGYSITLSNLRGSNTPDVVNELDVEQYLGNWYQIYGAPTNIIFQGYGECLTAEYGLLDNGDVSVLNSQINSDYELEQISGYAYYTNTSEPGKLSVHLDGVPVDSPYWVVKLGEELNGQYQYSIISVPSGVSLWVLARNIEDFYDKYDEEVKEYLNENSFKYETIIQDDSCEYYFTSSEAKYTTELVC